MFGNCGWLLESGEVRHSLNRDVENWIADVSLIEHGTWVAGVVCGPIVHVPQRLLHGTLRLVTLLVGHWVRWNHVLCRCRSGVKPSAIQSCVTNGSIEIFWVIERWIHRFTFLLFFALFGFPWSWYIILDISSLYVELLATVFSFYTLLPSDVSVNERQTVFVHLPVIKY